MNYVLNLAYIHIQYHIQQISLHHLREQFLLFHSIYNTLQCSFPNLNDSCPILTYFRKFLSSSKVGQVQAFLIQNWQDIQQRPVNILREHFLLFHSIHNTLQCFFPDLNNLLTILAYCGQFRTSS